MEKRVSGISVVQGEVTPAGDKSISHRAVILNSIAEGKAEISNFSPGGDCLSTLVCLESLGVEIKRQEPAELPPFLEVWGVGRAGLREAGDVLDAGNSATTVRLLAGLLATQPFLSIITGDASLRSRPMGRVIHPLSLMGAHIWGRGEDSLVPLAIKGGTLHGIEYTLPVPSAQLKSALLIAALFAEGGTTIEEPLPSRDHTERLLKAMGANLERNGSRIFLTPSPLTPLDLHIPGDISSAAYWLVAGAIHPHAEVEVVNCGVNPTRSGIIDVLRDMGARLEVIPQRQQESEPAANIRVKSSDLMAVDIDSEKTLRLIDEIPLLALAACVARGTTTIRDAGELRVKESDRIATTVKELSALGARIEELPDGIIIHGGRQLRGAAVDSHGDHRLAMTLGIAALVAQGETVISNAGVADISYPAFWQDMDRLTRSSRKG
jgi:3-phosphoshikimate 1-carboxyvinyltransferase